MVSPHAYLSAGSPRAAEWTRAWRHFVNDMCVYRCRCRRRCHPIAMMLMRHVFVHADARASLHLYLITIFNNNREEKINIQVENSLMVVLELRKQFS